MKSYLTYFKLKFITGLQYRAAALAGLSTQFFFGLVYIMVYVAFFESGKSSLPMTLSQTITYLWLNQAFFSLINQFYKDKELFNLVISGNISYELARPKNLYFMWYFKILGSRLAMVSLRCIPLILVTSILPEPFNLSLPASPIHFILFILTLIVGTLLVTSIITLYPIIVLKTMNEKEILISHALDKKRQSSENSMITHTNFLSLDEISIVKTTDREYNEYVDTFYYGGFPDAERTAAVFGSM